MVFGGRFPNKIGSELLDNLDLFLSCLERARATSIYPSILGNEAKFTYLRSQKEDLNLSKQ